MARKKNLPDMYERNLFGEELKQAAHDEIDPDKRRMRPAHLEYYYAVVFPMEIKPKPDPDPDLMAALLGEMAVDIEAIRENISDDVQALKKAEKNSIYGLSH